MAMSRAEVPPRQFLGVRRRWWLRLIAAVVAVSGLALDGHMPPYDISDLPLGIALLATPLAIYWPITSGSDYAGRYLIGGHEDFKRPDELARLLGFGGGLVFTFGAIWPHLFSDHALPRGFWVLLALVFFGSALWTFRRNRIQLFCEIIALDGTRGIGRIDPGSYIIENATIFGLPRPNPYGRIILELHELLDGIDGRRYQAALASELLSHPTEGGYHSWSLQITKHGDVMVFTPLGYPSR